MDVFFTQEISGFNPRPILLNGDVDKEKSMHKSCLVMEAKHNILDHVMNMTANGSDSGQLLPVSPSFVSLEPLLFLSKETQVYIDVIEITPEVPFGALHKDYVPLPSDVNIFWSVYSLIVKNHFQYTNG